jgi:Leucine-rich repeat (LRR) protein
MTPEEGYREAEQRITEAQRSRTIGLYLSNLQLTKIPPQIAQLSNLQILYLDKNKIVEIPDAITQPNFIIYKFLPLIIIK